ncbi:MAG TPA: hypothetical protein IAC33_10810 [Candidatus Fimousia stercorigallinarum]|nr:hypothetical protein [Candidatus Fimousia stercorigallinarum]
MKRYSVKYIRFRNLQTQINGYGYHYSFSKYLVLLFLGMGVMIGIGMLNGLKLVNICILSGMVVLLIPVLLIVQFRYLYEQQRFQSVVNYMEQMMYSFQKHSKIVSALEEVEALMEGDIQFRIRQIRSSIASSKSVSYKEAFQMLEVAYPCDRLMIMHELFIKVESIGGEYQAVLASMLEDTKLWTERVYLFQKERSQMKRKIVLSIFCVLILCVVLFRMLVQSEQMAMIVDSSFYQIGTTLIIALFLLMFALSQWLLTGDWIKRSKEVPQEQLIQDWQHVRSQKDQFPRARKRLQKEAEKQFPRWLTVMILNLQTENVFRALVESIDDAPFVLRSSLQILVEELKEDPVSMKPYHHFLQELQTPEIHSTMKMLYAYTNVGTKEANDQLEALMKRKIVLEDRAERIQNEDEIAKYLCFFYVPMFLGTAKIMLDMSLMFVVMFSMWGQLL